MRQERIAQLRRFAEAMRGYGAGERVAECLDEIERLTTMRDALDARVIELEAKNERLALGLDGQRLLTASLQRKERQQREAITALTNEVARVKRDRDEAWQALEAQG